MNLTAKTLAHRGAETTVYFRELTGGEMMELAKGKTASHSGVGAVTMNIDFGDELGRDFRLVQFTLCSAEGKQIYRTLAELLKEPGSKLKALKALANDASREFLADDEESKPGKE